MNLRAKLLLKKESQSSLAPALQQLRQSGELLDVTLVSEDGTAVEAHRLVLSASSPVFRAMLGRHSQTQAIVFLPGASSSHLNSILDFLYTGETSVNHDEIDNFLGLANRFSIKELCNEQVNNLKTVSSKVQKVKLTHTEWNEPNVNINKNEDTQEKENHTDPLNIENSIANKNEDIEGKNSNEPLQKNISEKSENLSDLLDRMFRKIRIGHFECNSCGKKSGSAPNAREHAETHLELSFPCKLCRHTYSTSASFRLHKCKSSRS